MRSVLEIFISFTVEQFPMLEKLMRSQRRAQIEKLMLDAVRTYLTQLAQHQGQQVSMSDFDREVLLQYNVCGLVGVLMEYGGRKKLDAEQLASRLESILSGSLSGWKER